MNSQLLWIVNYFQNKRYKYPRAMRYRSAIQSLWQRVRRCFVRGIIRTHWPASRINDSMSLLSLSISIRILPLLMYSTSSFFSWYCKLSLCPFFTNSILPAYWGVRANQISKPTAFQLFAEIHLPYRELLLENTEGRFRRLSTISITHQLAPCVLYSRRRGFIGYA